MIQVRTKHRTLHNQVTIYKYISAFKINVCHWDGHVGGKEFHRADWNKLPRENTVWPSTFPPREHCMTINGPPREHCMTINVFPREHCMTINVPRENTVWPSMFPRENTVWPSTFLERTQYDHQRSPERALRTSTFPRENTVWPSTFPERTLYHTREFLILLRLMWDFLNRCSFSVKSPHLRK